MNPVLWLTLKGADIPDLVHLDIGVLAEFLAKWKEVLGTFSEEKNVGPGGDILASLVEIRQGSAQLGIQTYPELSAVLPGLIDPIANGDYQQLPPKTHQKVYELGRDVQKREWTVLVTLPQGKEKVLISPEHPVPRRQTLELTDTVNIYGKILRLGGVTPRIDVRTRNGKEYHVATDEETIQGLKVYTPVGLRVQANARQSPDGSWDLENPKLVEILPYKGGSLAEAIWRLAEAGGETWRKVDVEDYLTKLRGEL